jgi:hypothetical protein
MCTFLSLFLSKNIQSFETGGYNDTGHLNHYMLEPAEDPGLCKAKRKYILFFIMNFRPKI